VTQDIADFELQQEPGGAPLPPTSRPPSFVPLVVGALVVIAGAGAYIVTRQDAATPAPSGSATSTEATVEPPRPLGADVAPIDLPPLDETDALVRELVRALSSHPRLAAWLTTDGLIRNFTVVVDNVADGRTPANHLRVLRPTGGFRPIDAGGTMVMDLRSYDRYNDLAAAAASVDTAGAARLYATLKPRIEDAYRELGQDAPFDRAIERAIVHLLQAPVLQGEISLVPRGAVYDYNDSRIERLSQAQKQLLRMGPRNMRIIQRKLRDIGLAMGIPPERLPER
jgi:hypothetical protein